MRLKTMKNKFFNKSANVAQKPSNIELLKKSITEFCYAAALDEDEAKHALGSIFWNEEVDPVLYWEFRPICTFEVCCTDEAEHKLKHNRLFNRNGILIGEYVHKSPISMLDVKEIYELWLLEDMTLEVTFSCHVSVKKEMVSECAVYRYHVENGFKYFCDADIEEIVDEISTKIRETRSVA